MSHLIILESPFKINTIKGYLGSGYKIVASKGHVRDLPKSSLGVDIDNGFEPHYINIRGKGDLIKELKKESAAADVIYLATDPDREGEAISWHLFNALELDSKKTKRITFNELTKKAVREAVKSPREINMNTVNAQQTRRILDRLVGYKLSPFLWKTVKSGLSAGRVQSVATRIIVERENEIRAFVPEEYWTLDAVLINSEGKTVRTRFVGDGRGKIALSNEEQTKRIIDTVSGNSFVAKSVKKAAKQKSPLPPFTTSTMQQEASKKLGFQSQRIMRVAQELYEGIDLGSEYGGVHGLISYMRTDSLRISDEAAAAASEYIKEKYGEDYLPEKRRIYTQKANAQDAHEAIRPVNLSFEPQAIKKHLSSDQYRLYKLIWDRFIASQMANAVLDTVSMDFENSGYIFRASGYVVTFRGHLAVYSNSADDKENESADVPEDNIRLPAVREGEVMKTGEIIPQQKYTEPPARFTEASLIKFLEEKGIGRPSTYTPIITTIIARSYVTREGKSLVPTKLGEVTTQIMTEYFPEIVDYPFTAKMESRLDEIENGTVSMNSVLEDFYDILKSELSDAESSGKGEVHSVQPSFAEETDIICDKCGSRMVVKSGRFGKFAACPNYPACKNTLPLGKDGKPVLKKEKEVKKAGFKCDVCGAEMVIREGRFGSFYACENYPKCKNTKPINNEIGVACPECGAKIVQRFTKTKKIYYVCERYPDCKFSSWDMPTDQKCPKCGKVLFIKKAKNILYCADKECGYRSQEQEEK
ncbi:MAG: type I DNA topoisomerase [Clostridia bacterium]|nr:type I DNA topoisomerase [Clostridia bacterium]